MCEPRSDVAIACAVSRHPRLAVAGRLRSGGGVLHAPIDAPELDPEPEPDPELELDASPESAAEPELLPELSPVNAAALHCHARSMHVQTTSTATPPSV